MELVKAKLEDDEFLYEVYASSRMDEINEWQWDEQQKQQFLKMQYYCQKVYYKNIYSHLETRIIVSKNEKIGRLLLADFKEKFVIVDLTILPEFQNQGVGTKILVEVQGYAQKHQKDIQLSVYRSNEGAIKLYEQLGFQQVECTDMYIFMEWLS